MNCGITESERLRIVWDRHSERMEQCIEALKHVVNNELQDMEKAERRAQQAVDFPSIGKHPQHKWGQWGKQRPSWARECSFIKVTRRPR